MTEIVALNADIVGYSQLMADDFEATSKAMKENRSVVEEEVALGGGEIANFVGDSFMAVFSDAKSAVQAAISITTSIEHRNRTVPNHRQVRFRMGLDSGRISVSDGHYEGDVLNTAARIQAIARPGGLSVSGRVYRALDEPALRFQPTGAHRLKGIPEPVDIFEFLDLPSDGAGATKQGSLSLEIPTVAVLPIHTESVDETVSGAARMIRAELLHRLAKVPELKVVDATSMPEVPAQSETARYMLETGVHQFRDTVRVFATLFDVSTMNVVKSNKWSTTPADMPEIAEEVAEDVSRYLEVELVVGAPAGLYSDLDDPEAIQDVYLGWYHLRTDTIDGWRQALDLFGQVSDAHPDQPYGHVLSAFANWIGAANGWADPETTLERARGQAQAGIDVGDPTGMGKAVDAAVLMTMGRVDEAMDAMEEVEIVRPTCDVTYGLEGSIRRYMGDWEQAVDLLDLAMQLTGINKPWYPTVKACALFVGKRLEAAASLAQSVLDYQPHNLEALLVLAAAQSELGLNRRARATAQTIREEFPTVDVLSWLDSTPYQDSVVVERWKADLASVGLSD